MKIKGIEIENFKGFNKLSLDFNEQNVVLVGANGAGKSTVLNATVILLSRMVESLSYGISKKVSINENDIKNGKQRLKLKCTLKYGDLEGELAVTKVRAKNQKNQPKLIINDTSKEIVSYLHEKLEEKQQLNMPIFVNYPVHRNVIDIPLRIRTRHEFDQFSAYQNSFSSGADFRVFFEWYRNQEDMENEEKLETNLNYEDKQLKAIRKAIYNFMPGFSDLRIMRKGKMRMVITKGKQRLEVNQLSDGEKCTLAMIGDLARRLALANPSLDNPLEGEGVVLIDEIDLHLHPAWQREIINRLQTTFPNIQFILTTHSPQVLGEIKSAQIFLISQENNEEGIDVRRVPTLFGKDTNMILENFMNAAEKNLEIKEQQRKLFKLLMQSKLVEAKSLMDYLVDTLGNEDPSLVKADIIYKRKASLEE